MSNKTGESKNVGKKKRGPTVWRVLGLGIVLVGVASGAFLQFDGMGRVEAWGAHRQAEEAIVGGDWPRAIREARRATVLDPASRRYVLTYEDAQLGFMLNLESRLEDSVGALERLRLLREAVRPLRSEFQDSYREELRALASTSREQFAATMESALDGPLEGLEAMLEVFRGGDVEEYFRQESYARLQRIERAGELVVVADGQWTEGERLRAIELLGEVDEDYRRGAYVALRGQIGDVHRDVVERKANARGLASDGRHLEARQALLELQEHVDWVPAVGLALEAVDVAGLEAHTAALVSAVLARDGEQCAQRLAEFAAFRGADFPLSVDDLLAPKTYDQFAAKLLEAGIMPGEGEDRRHYLDVVLCAAVVDTYEDGDNARQQIAAGYVDWARDMFDKGKYGNAAYLASIASELNPGVGQELYGESLRMIEEGLRFVVVTLEPANNSGERLNTLPTAGHAALVPQVVERLPGSFQLVDRVPSPESGRLILPIQLRVSVERLDTSTSADTQMLSARYVAGSEWVNNPQYPGAEQAVIQAQGRVQNAQRLLSQVRQTASMSTRNNPFGAIVSMATVTAAETDLRDAENALRSAQQRLSGTPRTVSRDRVETFNYPRITHSVDVQGEGQLVLEGPFGARREIRTPFRTSYQTVEVKGDPAKGVQSQLPQFRSLAQLEGELAQRWMTAKRGEIERLRRELAAIARESLEQVLDGSDLPATRRNDAELSFLLLTCGSCDEQDGVLLSDRWTGVFGRTLTAVPSVTSAEKSEEG